MACKYKRSFVIQFAEEMVESAFNVLDIEAVRAATDLPNTASAAVLRRLGMSQDRTTDEGEAGTGFFSIDRVTWLSVRRIETRTGAGPIRADPRP